MSINVPKIDFPELFFGFVSPIGADHSLAIRAFRNYFQSVGYRVVPIKVTNVFQVLKQHIPPKVPLVTFPLEQKYDSFIKYGDQLRAEFDDDSFLAASAIVRIIRKRNKFIDTDQFHHTVYLIDQFKRPEEIELLRAVYGQAFYQISAYSRRGTRIDALSRKFASSHSSHDQNSYRADAEKLVQIDENECEEINFSTSEDKVRNTHGQKVTDIFYDADFIVNLDMYAPTVDEQVVRFCDLLFSSNIKSPTKMEHGMFLARGAALRSLDVSRQVGACVLGREGQIICLGANEVPKAGGGTYWADGKFDDRDFRRGSDPNARRKREILGELLSVLGHKEKLDDVLRQPAVRESQFMDALEYSRVIHAEMNAISDAARSGRSLQDATLYCTTFPCHMCAKHIIASGLAEVVFLEPYPKSLASQSHDDSIQVEGCDRGRYSHFPSVQFAHFFGVTPRRYQEVFSRGKRKDGDGNFVEYRNGKRAPYINVRSPYYSMQEVVVLNALEITYKSTFGVSTVMDVPED